MNNDDALTDREVYVVLGAIVMFLSTIVVLVLAKIPIVGTGLALCVYFVAAHAYTRMSCLDGQLRVLAAMVACAGLPVFFFDRPVLVGVGLGLATGVIHASLPRRSTH